jgi:anti-anti-sigma factor
MFTVTVQELGDASVLGCKGRIVIGNAYSTLRHAVRSQGQASMLILDLARVDRIDAGGLGVLLSVREWARSGAVRFKLMNVTRNVEQILELTNLQRVFEFCSVRDLLCLLHRAASMKSWRDRAHPTRENDSRDCRVEGRDDVSAVRSGDLFAAAS